MRKPMASYEELKSQIAKLESLAEQARQQELGEAKAKIRELMAKYGLSPNDLIENPTQPKREVQRVPPKYKDPDSGKTWTGRGRRPAWAEGKNLAELLIK